ncbi:SLBB domain-containing protein [uncultured Draconibacterium sp.]|uniref:SLBB domain-containing protein n=1 Tax=uncultured Draconibacterium sp. TaxID=1573823 RepID=UPI0025DB5F79|nr:SLBB domain-containing protein [uncultured Draconibacterium sp.]
MKGLIRISTLALTLAILAMGTHAQDVQNVDVKTLPQSDIKKAQQAMQDAGLSVDQAAEIARQKGATEQQIRDFENRINDGNTSGAEQIISDPVEEANEMVEDQQDVEKSTRQAGFDSRGRIFGSYLFNSKNLTFEPSTAIQTPKTYEIGIGDQLLINIWGNSQNNYQLTVNQNGQILIPDVGPLYIAGMSFETANSRIKQRLTEIYSDMGGNNPGTFAQVNMGQLRSIQVNLVGEVTTPGTYTLPVTASVFNALYLSGGPNNIGSFRNIKVIRDNKTLKTIDIYKFLVDADPSDNISLKDNDILFIPPAEKRVEVEGEFRRTGIFEMKENEMLDVLVRFAGGFTENAYLQQMQIHRKTQQGQQIVDVTFNRIGTTPLVNGDVISNTRILESFENRVSISGAVYRPGEYEWVPGMTLADLVNKADGLSPDVYKNRGLITRFNPDLTTLTLPFAVDQLANGSLNIPLQQEDIVTIKSHFSIGEQASISISGEVMTPGQLPWSENTTLSDVLFMAGGYTEAADSSFIEISRRLSYSEASQISDSLVHIFNIKHSRGLKIDGDQPFYLEPYDRISVKRAPGYREQASATITGEVVYAGNYALRNKNQRISDLVALAKGITPQAFLDGATLRRTTPELGTENIAIDLRTILKQPGGENDLLLRNGDILSIPEFMQTVKISGAIQSPFSVTYEEGQKLRFYIDKTGGFSKRAIRRKTYVQYPNGYTASTKSFIFKNYPEIKPGSEIIVPKREEKDTSQNVSTWLAIASAFSSLAIAIAAAFR